MKTIFSAIAFVITFLSSSAFAQSQFYDTARVMNVQPLYEQAAQTRDCYQQPQQRERSNTGGVIGGIAGGLLGSQVGAGNGRLVATAVGALVGGLAGDRTDNRNDYQQGSNTGSNCQNQYANQVAGYLVTYEYNGRQVQKRMSFNPGQTVRVVVSVDVQ